MSHVKGFTADMATHNATPFLHRRLYRDHTPHCILSCFATSALYANRTPANTAMVMRAIQSSVRELIDAESGRIIATPTEKLARSQALFLYQIIRLFNGDVALRAQGERDTPLLLTWLVELCKVRDNLGDVAQIEHGEARNQPPKEWQVRSRPVFSWQIPLLTSLAPLRHGYSPSLCAGPSSWLTRS